MRVVIKDLKTWNSGQQVFEAPIVAAMDYYAFGMIMPGRSYTAGDYRYGYNGKEKDDEVKGSGNSYDFGARIYDSRIAKFLSTDYFIKEYVPYTPYGFALNNPIFLKDADGNVVVDSKGRPITISIQKAKDGSATATFQYEDGTPVVDKDFLENGGTLINAMIQTRKGRSLIKQANRTSDKVHYVYVSDKLDMAMDKGVWKLRLGSTEQDENGVYQIKVNKKSFEEEKNAFESGVKKGEFFQPTDEFIPVKLTTEENRPYSTEEEFKAVVGGHETKHFLNKNRKDEGPSNRVDHRIQKQSQKNKNKL